jgi:hypothetical protein
MPTCSVAQLEDLLERNVKLPRRMLCVHRVKAWRRTYFDTPEAEARMLFEDEHIDMHGERTRLSTSRRVLLIVLASLAITVAIHVVSAAGGDDCLAAASLCGVAILAWSPTFDFNAPLAGHAPNAFSEARKRRRRRADHVRLRADSVPPNNSPGTRHNSEQEH